jgi:hypothetical protein
MATPDTTDIAAPLAIGGGLAASPFLGLIGERRIRKDPFFTQSIKRMSPKQLAQLASPGDVILGSQRGTRSVRFKLPQLYTTGSEFYHAEPVAAQYAPSFSDPDTGKTVTKGKPLGKTIEAGRMSYSGKKGIDAQKLLKKGPSAFTQNIPFTDYEDTVLLRPDKKLSSKDIRRLQLSLIEGGTKPYSNPMGVRALGRDLFIPKIPGITGKIGPLMQNEGHMCSSLPSSIHEKLFGQQITAGKHPKHVLPADFLREGSPFKPIAASLKNPEALKNILAKRMAFRGGLGAGLGGLGLAGYYEPEVFPGIAAGIGAPIGIRKLLEHLRSKEFPKTLRKFKPSQEASHILPTGKQLTENVGSLKDALRHIRETRTLPRGWKSLDLLKRFGTRTLPLALGGGLAAYLGTKALTN